MQRYIVDRPDFTLGPPAENGFSKRKNLSQVADFDKSHARILTNQMAPGAFGCAQGRLSPVGAEQSCSSSATSHSNYCSAIIGTAMIAATIPAVFQGVKCSLRIMRASSTVTAGYKEVSTTAVSSRPVWLARTESAVPLTSRHPAKMPRMIPL